LLKKQLMLEHGILAAVGLLIGLVSAALAMVPALTVSGAKVEIGFQAGLFLVVLLSCLGCLAVAVLIGTKGEPLSGLRSE
jgi:ABC-type antimicrobial peptide transport system permease subunit